MPRPKDPTLQDKIQEWVENNPDRWYTAEYKDISVETGVSTSTVYRYYMLIVAKAANITPSEVKEKREEHFGVSPWKRRLSDEEIAMIRRLYNAGCSPLDIAFITGRSLSQVGKYKPKRKKRKPRPPATQDTE